MTLRTDHVGTAPSPPVGVVAPPQIRVSLPVLNSRARTENLARLSKSARARQAALADEMMQGLEDIQRPKTRGDCVNGVRPCPFVSCRYHLALDVHHETIKYNFPRTDIADMKHTCSLDIADHRGTTLEEVAEVLNITRERVRQLEMIALRKMQKRAGKLRECADDDSLIARPAHGVGDRLHRTTMRGPGRKNKEEVEEEVEEKEERELDWAPSAIWDLSQPETKLRADAASFSMYRTYMDGSIAHGFERVDAKFANRLEGIEHHIGRSRTHERENDVERVSEEPPPPSQPVALAHGDRRGAPRQERGQPGRRRASA